MQVTSDFSCLCSQRALLALRFARRAWRRGSVTARDQAHTAPDKPDGSNTRAKSGGFRREEASGWLKPGVKPRKGTPADFECLTTRHRDSLMVELAQECQLFTGIKRQCPWM